jgi:uncharacterized protein (DUF927 family)
MIDFRAVKEAVHPHLASLLHEYFPEGTMQGDEFICGDALGRPGRSFRFNVKKGVGTDFAGQRKIGDIITVIASVRGCSNGDAARELSSKYNITPRTPASCRKKAQYTDPRKSCPAVGPPAKIQHPEYGVPSASWTYRNADGELLGYACRFDTGPDDKIILPFTHWRHPDTRGTRWTWKAFPAPRPLYGLDRLASRPDAPVLVVEGEKATDAAQRLLPDHVCVTWPGGCKAVHHADWSPLKERNVTIWPDADEPGRLSAEEVARKISAQVITPPQGVAKGWDLADAEAESWTMEQVLDLLGTTQGEHKLAGDTGGNGDIEENASDTATPDKKVHPGTPGTVFFSNSKGVWFRPDGDDQQPIWICSLLEVTALTRTTEGEAWGRLLEFPDSDGRPHTWACPMETLAGDGLEFRRILLSLGLRIAPSGKARQLLANYVQTAHVNTRATCTDKPGWHSGSFVLPGETIGQPDGERILLQYAGEPMRWQRSGTLPEWQNSIARYCMGNSRLILAVSMPLAGPLLNLVGDESGGIHLTGNSSTGKTTVLRVAASVCGGPEFLNRWRATANGLEAVATAHNDGLLILDELAQVDPRDAGEISYLLANGSGKHRARRDGLSKKAATWRLLFLSAGEIGLADHMLQAGKKARAGQEVRLADIPADAGHGAGIFEDLHEFTTGAELADHLNRQVSNFYGTALGAYLRNLVLAPSEEIKKRIDTLRFDFLKEHLPTGADGQARRVASRLALIAAGGELATTYGITGWERGTAINAAATCLKAWIGRRGGAGSQEETAALAQVQHFIEAHGEARFTDLEKKSDRPTVNRAGYRRKTTHGTEYLVLPEVFRREVCCGLDYRFVGRVLRGHGLLKSEAPDRLTIKPREVGRVYCLVVTTDAE